MKSIFINSVVAFLLFTWSSLDPCWALEPTKPIVKKEAPSRQNKKAPDAVSTENSMTAEPVKSTKPKFTLKSIEGTRVDENFGSISLDSLVAATERIAAIKKGEFESTAEFNDRRNQAISEKFLGDYSTSDAFAVVSGVDSGANLFRGISYRFNADTGDVSVFVLPRVFQLNGIGSVGTQAAQSSSHGLDIIDLDYRTDSQRTYQGSNAYGAAIEVSESNVIRTGIAAAKIPFLGFKRESLLYSQPSTALQFKMPNAVAARELPNLKALIIFKLKEPYIIYHFSRSKPTRESPLDVAVQHKYLAVDLIGIVFYSGLTGEIFARLPDAIGTTDGPSALSRADFEVAKSAGLLPSTVPFDASEKVASTGESIASQSLLRRETGVYLTSQVEDSPNAPGVTRINAGLLRLDHVGNNGRFYRDPKATFRMLGASVPTENGGIFVPDDKSKPAVVYHYRSGGVFGVGRGYVFGTVPVPVSQEKNDHWDEASYRKELLYSGLEADSIVLTYREFRRDPSIPIFLQVVKRNAAAGSVVSYRGVKIEIKEASPTSLRYKVLNTFD